MLAIYMYMSLFLLNALWPSFIVVIARGSQWSIFLQYLCTFRYSYLDQLPSVWLQKQGHLGHIIKTAMYMSLFYNQTEWPNWLCVGLRGLEPTGSNPNLVKPITKQFILGASQLGALHYQDRARTGCLSVRIILLSEISGNGTGGLLFHWSNTIQLP